MRVRSSPRARMGRWNRAIPRERAPRPRRFARLERGRSTPVFGEHFIAATADRTATELDPGLGHTNAALDGAHVAWLVGLEGLELTLAPRLEHRQQSSWAWRHRPDLGPRAAVEHVAAVVHAPAQNDDLASVRDRCLDVVREGERPRAHGRVDRDAPIAVLVVTAEPHAARGAHPLALRLWHRPALPRGWSEPRSYRANVDRSRLRSSLRRGSRDRRARRRRVLRGTQIAEICDLQASEHDNSTHCASLACLRA